MLVQVYTCQNIKLFEISCQFSISLYFSRNRLTELPSCVGKVKNLKSLHIEYNKISQLCEEMGELIHLEDLVITRDSHLLNTVAQLVER